MAEYLPGLPGAATRREALFLLVQGQTAAIKAALLIAYTRRYHRAGATYTASAHPLGSGTSKLITDDFDSRLSTIDFKRSFGTVNDRRDAHRFFRFLVGSGRVIASGYAIR